ncbi:MAG: hypothetical protein V4539_19525 [Bacteroidota bacterium]
MADNTDEEHLDNPINTHSESSPDEITPTAGTESINPNQETENMEVHHHAHATHGKKTWKNYFWEFLMLFLAVFCGFLAEWKLEHIIEHSREKEFMESMVIDIKTDSSNLASMKSAFGYITIQIDSLLPLLKDNEHLEKNATEIYEHQVILNLYKKWTYSDRTIDQLKNSGTFRLIRKKAVSDGISQYDGFIRNYINDMQNSLILKQWQGINDAGNDIFKSSVFREYFKSGDFARHAVVLPNTPYFLTNDKIVLEKFINKLDQYAVSLDWFRMNIDRALQQNKTLDSLIRKEYHVESN